ncbi:hypothetical protein [Endozoicomonas sp. ALD040]|uniref:hypothetical protein n=1 Tax=Endozoicomonas sp. ALD040 TaxID=3403079 RepID=UPI003BAFF45F
MKAKEFDQAFDEGHDSIDEHIDWPSAQRPGLNPSNQYRLSCVDDRRARSRGSKAWYCPASCGQNLAGRKTGSGKAELANCSDVSSAEPL